MKRVSVVPHDPAWAEAFRLAEAELIGAFAPEPVVVHHIGSTSVPGLWSKPVIDILIEVAALAAAEQATPRLEALGYGAKGEYGIAGRRYFSRPASGRSLKVHLHAFAVGHEGIRRHLAFRDYLRAHPAIAGDYGELKRDLATRHADDRDRYQTEKAAFCQALESAALSWRDGSGLTDSP